MNKTDKSLVRLTEKIHITKITDERWYIHQGNNILTLQNCNTLYITKTKIIVKKCYEQLYANKLDNFNERQTFLKLGKNTESDSRIKRKI